MRYPTLSQSKCRELADQMLSGAKPAIEPHQVWVGRDSDLDLRPIRSAAETISAEMRQWDDSDRDRFEGMASIRLYESLRHVSSEVLDDRGFWRFLSLRYYWDFIAWREEGPFARGNHLKYVNATTNTEAVLPRMYARANAIGGREYGELASAISKAGDFWRSHIVRVRTGSAQQVTRALAAKQANDRLITAPIRDAAKRLNRTWTNIVLYMYDDEGARELVDRIWDEVRSSRP